MRRSTAWGRLPPRGHPLYASQQARLACSLYSLDLARYSKFVSNPGSLEKGAARPWSHHIPVLDGIRAIAVSMVLLLHVSYGVIKGGFLGVDLFFVLSGYLITLLLLREFRESGNIRFDLFYLRRAYRLLPPILLLLITVALLRFLLPDMFPSELSWWFSSIAVLFFFANFMFYHMDALEHTWSLSLEEQFYFLWPMTLFWILKLRRSLLFCLAFPSALVVFCVVLRAWLESIGGGGIILYTFLFTRMDSLLLGAIAAIAGEASHFRSWCAGLVRFRVAEGLMLALAVLLLLCDQESRYLYYGGFTLISFSFTVLLLALVHQNRETLLRNVLQSPTVAWLGKRSYGIYLYHFPIIPMFEFLRVKQSILNFILVSLLRLAVPIILADLSYRFVELPFLRRKVLFKWNIRKTEPKAGPPVTSLKPPGSAR